MMKSWLNELRKRLEKRFYEEEVDEIVLYYQEMIEERIEKGESIDLILSSYDIKEIIKNITPEIVMKRNHQTYQSVSKSTKQVILVLLSTPLLIPLGVTYIAMVVTAFSLLVASAAIAFSGCVAIIVYIIDLVSHAYPLIDTLGLLGLGMIGFSIMMLTSVIFAKLVFIIFSSMLKIFVKLLKKGRGYYETI